MNAVNLIFKTKSAEIPSVKVHSAELEFSIAMQGEVKLTHPDYSGNTA